jgi:tetratricopeptide (TPR) repeat protein
MEKTTKHNRDREMMDIVRGLLLAEAAFRGLSLKFAAGTLLFSDVEPWVDDHGRSLLYNLKERGHSLFRYAGEGVLSRKEWLLDLAVGSIFHEAMKLRENLYQLQYYSPKYLEYAQKAGRSEYEKDYLQQFEQIIRRAGEGVREGMDELTSLFRDAREQLADFFGEWAKNPYFVRFLLDIHPLLEKVYGTARAKGIFDRMFEGGIHEAHVVAGRSYLAGKHYDLAVLSFLKASRKGPSSVELRCLIAYSQGMKAYFDNAYPKALSHFAAFLRLQPSGRAAREGLRKVEEVCHKIASEWAEEKETRQAARARSLAEKIRKMLG